MCIVCIDLATVQAVCECEFVIDKTLANELFETIDRADSFLGPLKQNEAIREMCCVSVQFWIYGCNHAQLMQFH